ncbi:hypothetical protein mRhiFer1_008986 [Rhinolophus ferrumequinum]|uniref:B box-type domain-containing protein n=1 Tax=Rhinolophus ferrumequinum TaxID=59479 RepID=A0A7J7TDZ3_RHIFE|nr:hypothetical protein mRhiFer1_008986 [Rhinolophus ferrumequinum]
MPGCPASLCEKHQCSHFAEQVFRDHQLLEPVWDLKSCLCQKHRKLQRLYCRTEGCCVCGTCLLEQHKNHDTIPLGEERARREVEGRQVQASVETQRLMITSDSRKHRGQVAFLSKLIQTTRDEVNYCFSEIIQEVKPLQVKVLDFVDKEEAAALGKLGRSIQPSHNRLLKLEGDSIWLRTNQSDQQFRQEFPRLKHFPDCIEPLVGTNCEKKQSFLQLPETLAELRSQLMDVGLSFVNQLLLRGIKMNSYEVLPSAVDRKTLLKSLCRGQLLPGFKGWPQVLCSRGLSEGHHDWEAKVSNSWVCRGVTYRRSSPLSGRRPRNIVYLLGRNPYSWCLEWDALNVADSGSLGYRFLASFLEPLHPAVTVSSRALVTLKQV